MPITLPTVPADLVLAVLHKVAKSKPEIKLKDDEQLASIFDSAAQEFGGGFAEFTWDSRYQYSEALTGVLQILDLGGSIEHPNAAIRTIRITDHTRGQYGEKVFNSLTQAEQEQVESVATRICREYA